MSNEEEIVPPNSLADAEREERIRQRAYQLWEEDGSQGESQLPRSKMT